MFQRIRAGLVVSALVGAAVVAPAGIASAAGSCGTGPVISTSTTATISDQERDDWFRVVSTGNVLVSYTSGQPNTTLEVYDPTCTTLLCAAVQTYYEKVCHVPASGTLNVKVRYTAASAGTWTYYLVATPTDTAGNQDCATQSGVEVCLTSTMGEVVQDVVVHTVTTPPAATHRIAGWVDTYRFLLPEGASVTVPCVTLVANATLPNACDQAGGEFVSRFATLADTDVTQPGPAIGPVVASVSVCSAEYTVTVEGFGVEDFPALALC